MKAKLVNIVLTATLVVSLFFVFIQTSTSGEYDPWIDSNDDGEIDIFDAINLAAAFGTSGTPINKTALLLELQARIDALNSTLMELLAQAACVVESGEFDGEVNSDMVEDSGANTVVNFQDPFITTEKPQMVISVVLKGPANGLTEGSAIKVVEDIKGAAGYWTGFDLTVSKYSDGSSISDTTQVYVTWIAIGPTDGMGTLVVTGSIPYDANGAYDGITGLSKDVSASIPSGFTLVSVVATGYKAHQMTGVRQAEPPLILEPKVNGTNIQTRVWDASGDEYGGSNWSNMKAHIDYTLFITK